MPIRWEFSRFFSMTMLLQLVLVLAWFGVPLKLPVPYYIHAGQILKLRELGQGIII